MKTQNYSNHSRLVAGSHGLTFFAILAFWIGSFVNLADAEGPALYSASLLSVAGFIFVCFFVFVRMFALKAQDRAIRAEENLRHFVLTGKLLPASLRIGQKFKVTKDLSANDLVVAQTPAEQYQEYRVQSGDSVTAIAVRFGMSVKDLKAINNLRSSQIKIGQRLKVVAQPVVQRYKVKSGDNLSAIAAEYNTSVKALLELNDLSSAAIWVGQVLKVPTK